MIINCPVSLGELVDKISILRIKLQNISDSQKIENIKKEEQLLTNELNHLELLNIDDYLGQLFKINSQLWKIEDDIREKEKQCDFGKEFIELARSVYKVNDKRFEIKNQINKFYNSGLVEEKSYKKY